MLRVAHARIACKNLVTSLSISFFQPGSSSSSSSSSLDCKARLHIGPRMELASSRQRRDAGSIERELGAVPETEAVGDDLDPPFITDWRIEVHASEAHEPRDLRSNLAANSGGSVLERESSAGKDAGGGTCGAVVAERVEQPTAAAVARRKWQG